MTSTALTHGIILRNNDGSPRHDWQGRFITETVGDARPVPYAMCEASALEYAAARNAAYAKSSRPVTHHYVAAPLWTAPVVTERPAMVSQPVQQQQGRHMVVSNVSGSLLPHLDTVAVYGPFNWGSAAARRSARILAACAMVDVLAMVQGGASPLDVARFVRAQSLPVHVNLSHAIEDVSHPGTFADAVFEILCNG